MTNTITSARQLWESDQPDFCALLHVWEKQKRCPLPLADVLLEYGLERQAEAAKWAATYRDRRCFITGNQTGPYPIVFESTKDCKWYRKMGSDVYSDTLPCTACSIFLYHASVADALLALLDHWDV